MVDIKVKKEIFSDQPRFTIMFLIYLNKTIGFTELQKLLNLTPGNLDHHIKMLEKAGCIITRKKFSWRPLNIVQITERGTELFSAYIIYLKKILEQV